MFTQVWADQDKHILVDIGVDVRTVQALQFVLKGVALTQSRHMCADFMGGGWGGVSVCVSASQLSLFMFQLCLQRSFTTLDNSITGHSVLFILMTAQARNTDFSRVPLSFLLSAVVLTA